MMYLYLDNNLITSVDSRAFNDLSSLIFLLLNNNALTEVTENTFNHLVSLQALDLRRKHKESLLAHCLDAPADAVNSTAIRAALAAGESPPELAAEVTAYAHQNHLYRSAAAHG